MKEILVILYLKDFLKKMDQMSLLAYEIEFVEENVTLIREKCYKKVPISVKLRIANWV